MVLGLLLGTFGVRRLDRATWPNRCPAMGVLAWLTVLSAMFLCFLLAGAALVAHEFPSGLSGSALLHACSAFLAEHGRSHPSSAWTVVGIGGAASLGGGLAFVIVTAYRRQASAASRHLDLLDVVGFSHEEQDVVVLRHDLPSAYCLAGRRQRVIVTDAALSALTETQWRQVLAHERAHLRNRHHLWVRLATAFRTLFRGRLGTATAVVRVAELVEMHADDATDQARRWDLASAVLLLAAAWCPAGTLGASGSAAARIIRLTSPTEPLSRWARGAVGAMTFALWLSPVALAFTPGVVSLALGNCPAVL